MKVIIVTISAFLLLAPAAQCGVYVTNIVITSTSEPIGTNYFTVPTGKSLYVEYISMAGTNQFVYCVAPLPVGGLVPFTIAEKRLITTFGPPLKLDSGIIITVSSSAALVYGLIVDDADVYAAVSSEFQYEYVTAAGGLQGTLALASSRPASVKMEVSRDLQTWFEDPAGVFATRATEPTQWNYTAISPEKTAFFRAKARARKAP